MESPSVITDSEQKQFQNFLDELRGLGRKKKTLKAYTMDWKKFSQWYETANDERFNLSRLSTIDVQDYKSFLQTRGHAPATINRRLIFLKRYARFGMEQGIVQSNIQEAFRRIQGMRRQVLAPKSVSIRDLRRFLKELELRGPLRDQAMIYLFLYTGIRVGELVQLQKTDLHLTERKGTVHIRGEIAKGGHERIVPVPLEARERLSAYINDRSDSHPELFLGQRGPIKEDAAVRAIRKYAERVALSITPHLLRHTFAYQYLKKNENDLIGLASILGHENLNTTRIYTQKRLEDLQENAERVEFF